jgi:hypothetical protein
VGRLSSPPEDPDHRVVGIAASALIGGEALAVLSGLAPGNAELRGGLQPLESSLLAGFSLVVLALGTGGVLLRWDFHLPSGSRGPSTSHHAE